LLYKSTMNLAPEKLFPSQVMLSTRLISELGDLRSTLRATIQRDGPLVIVRVGGEIDVANEHTWRQLLTEAAAIATRPGPFIVDVNDVDFMGCRAFAVLADEAERCRHRGVALRLVSCNPGVVRIVAACGLDRVLPVHPTTDSALSAAVT
jgi:anti-anti-sigma factor